MFNIGDDNELDRLSREAADKYMHPVNSGWDAISAELDRVMPVREEKKRRFITWWLLPVAVAGGLAAWWAVGTGKNTSLNTSPAVHAAAQSAPDPKNTAGAVTVQQTPAESHASSTQGAVDSHAGSGSTVPALSLSPDHGLTSSTGVKPHSVRSSFDNNNNIDHTVSYLSPGAKANDANAAPPANNNVNSAALIPSEASNDPAAAASTNEVNTVKDLKHPSTEEPAPSSATSDATQNPSDAEDKSQKAAKKTTVAQPRYGRGFSFEILAGVDESNVKFTYGKGPGYNVGLMGGYHFNDRLSLHTGAIYTQKNYKLEGKDFSAPKGTPPSYYKLETVDGYCRMWEVPLTLRYMVNRSVQHGFYLEGGLSSYFMTHESYDYTWYNSGGVLVSRNIAYNSTDKHVLSILSLGAGLSNRVGSAWTMNIAPYARIPLGGVGFGSIHLGSYGVNLSFQHRLPAKK